MSNITKFPGKKRPAWVSVAKAYTYTHKFDIWYRVIQMSALILMVVLVWLFV